MERKKIKIKPEIRNYIIIGCCLFVVLLFILYFPRNYTKKYKINNYNIEEKYNKDIKRYSLSISLDDKVYEYSFENKYIGKKLIKKIDSESNDNTSCIVNHLKDRSNVVLCIKDNQNVDYRLVSDFDFSKYKKSRNGNAQKVDNIEVFDLVGKKYLVWNYNEFKFIEKEKNGNIKLFNNDYYNVSLTSVVNNYLVLPNYDSQFNFKELIIVNLKNKKKETWKLNYEVSFDSYILGTYKDSIYLVDKKNKIEYELNVKRRTMDILGDENRDGKILVNNKFENISLLKLVNNIMSFSYGEEQEYIVDGTKLLLKTNNTKVLLTNTPVTKIVYKTGDYVYYISNDTLYYYDYTYGEIKVMSNFEWNFNNNNVIYIY